MLSGRPRPASISPTSTGTVDGPPRPAPGTPGSWELVGEDGPSALAAARAVTEMDAADDEHAGRDADHAGLGPNPVPTQRHDDSVPETPTGSLGPLGDAAHGPRASL